MILPNVVIVSSASMLSRSATGITLTNLFEKWPNNQLSLVYFDPEHEGSQAGSFRLRAGLSAGKISVPPQVVSLLAQAGRRISGTSSSSEISSVSQRLPQVSFRTRMVRSLRVLTDALGGGLTEELGNFLDGRPPDVVYSVLGSLTVARAAEAVSQRYGAPLVPHFMDDWPTTRYADGALFGMGQRLVGRSVRRIVSAAPVCLAISDAMAREYGAHYDAHFESVMNPVPMEDFAFNPTNSTSDRGLRYLYAGGLHLGRLSPLLAIARTLARVDPTGELVIHTSTANFHSFEDQLTSVPCLRYAGELAPEEVSATLRAADVLIHVESFEPHYAAYARLSVSTKIPQYMAAGRPILAVCPDGLASGDYIASTGSGLKAASLNDGSIEALVQCLLQPSVRSELGKVGWDVAKRVHSQPVVWDKFANLLSMAASQGSHYRSGGGDLQ